VIYQRGPALTEWYYDTTWGLEQGFTLLRRPAGDDSQASPLVLELSLSGTLRPHLQDQTLLLCDSTGQVVARYSGLYAYDANGQNLPARLALAGDSLRILVDDIAAHYPITIDPWVQEAKLLASDAGAGDGFGCSVAIDGDTVVVGALADDMGSNADQGSVYVFQKPGSGWVNMTQTAKLTASDGAAGEHFGQSVALNGDTVVVGAVDPTSDSDLGSVYVFQKPGGGWADLTETVKLTASDGEAGDGFGCSVAIDGDTVVVGAPGDFPFGSVYIFKRPPSGWATTSAYDAKLNAGDMTEGGSFGASVGISADTVAVGAYRAVYVFEKPGDGWTTTSVYDAKLTASDGEALDGFGNSLSISLDTVAVGAYLDNIGSNDKQGSAYVFQKPEGGWVNMTQMAKLTASDGAGDDYFGYSVSISADTVVVGAVLDDIGSVSATGSAYVFKKPGGGWSNMTETAKLTASDAISGDYFGCSIAISGLIIVVGAKEGSMQGGSAYVFSGPLPPPSIAKDLMTHDFGTSGVSIDFNVWNDGQGVLSYNVSIIEGSDYFSVSPSNGTSTGISDKKTHTIVVNRSDIPRDQIVTGKVQIASSEADDGPQFINLSAKKGKAIPWLMQLLGD
jgi:hypothetical protein